MAAKKITKKTAKKAYPSSRKTIPRPKRITVEELAIVMAENHAKTEAAIDRLSTENRVTEKMLQNLMRTVDKTSASVEELSKNLGRLGKDIGELTEIIVIPKIRLAMNALGKHTFNGIQTDRTFRKIDDDGQKKPLTEVDVLLFGETEAMAVETKTRPTIREVKRHLERLEILRRNEELVGIKGKTLFGAVVGAVVDEDVKRFVLERGLYIVKIREEEDKLDIVEPDSCRTW